jgi:aspartate racemase
VRHLGILAHSTEGAAACFLTFCRNGFADLGDLDHPDVTMDCIALARSMPGWDSGDHAGVREILVESIRRLAGAGADFFVCPDNTAHMALGLDGPPLPLPGLHLPAVVADEAVRRGYRKVGVLGTSYTMDGPLYADALGRRGLDHAVPDEADRELVNRIIFEELLDGDLRPESRRAYVEIIEKLAADGCDAVGLVCTEIPLLVTEDDSPLPTLDSNDLLAAAAYEVAVERAPMPRWHGGTP